MTSQDPPPEKPSLSSRHNKDNLEDLMEQSLSGDPASMSAFFSALIQSLLWVPERFQKIPITNVANYPNEFLNLLAIQGPECAFVPAFTSQELLAAWGHGDLVSTQLTFSNLLERIPSEWWIVLNPGHEVEKEFSPWEIDLLKGGNSSIPALVAELCSDSQLTNLSVRALAANDYSQLQNEVISYASKTSAVETVFAALEKAETSSGHPIQTILLGVSISPSLRDQVEDIRSEIKALAESLLIGGDRVKVFAGAAGSTSVTLGIFKGLPPLYQRPPAGGFAPFHYVQRFVRKLLGTKENLS